MDNKKIGSFISELRKEKGMNQKELAQKLFVTDKAVSKWETGRGIPDVSILVSLSEVLGVSVGELLNGERLPKQECNDEQIIKKLRIKKYARLITEFIITIIFAYQLYIFYFTFQKYKNVLDFYLHKNEISFLSICSLIFIGAFVIWLVTVIVSALLKKRASVMKAIIVCMSFSFVIGCSIKMAQMDDSKIIEIFDDPVDTVNYVDYTTFFDNKYETQITIKDTNDIITENYSAYFDGIGDEYNIVYTDCVTANSYDIVKMYYEQRKPIRTNNATWSEIEKSICNKMEITDGYYITGLYGENSISLCFVKDNSYFEIEISNSNINDERLINQIKKL